MYISRDKIYYVHAQARYILFGSSERTDVCLKYHVITDICCTEARKIHNLRYLSYLYDQEKRTRLGLNFNNIYELF
jgi:hypothetical protein